MICPVEIARDLSAWRAALRRHVSHRNGFAEDRLGSFGKFEARRGTKGIDAIGKFDGTRCLIEWKTTSSRYPEEPDGLLALDPQLVCYSWMTGISEVAQVVFVRKRPVEVQFLPHGGIRFPQSPCSTCPYVGLCLGKQELVEIDLVKRPGADNLGWLDELAY